MPSAFSAAQRTGRSTGPEAGSGRGVIIGAPALSDCKFQSGLPASSIKEFDAHGRQVGVSDFSRRPETGPRCGNLTRSKSKTWRCVNAHHDTSGATRSQSPPSLRSRPSAQRIALRSLLIFLAAALQTDDYTRV